MVSPTIARRGSENEVCQWQRNLFSDFHYWWSTGCGKVTHVASWQPDGVRCCFCGRIREVLPDPETCFEEEVV